MKGTEDEAADCDVAVLPQLNRVVFEAISLSAHKEVGINFTPFV